MKVEKNSKNLRTLAGVGFSLLMSAGLALVTGCPGASDEEVKKGEVDPTKPVVQPVTPSAPEKIKYKTLSFSQAANAAIVGKDGKNGFSAAGRNGDGSDIYFGVKTVNGVVSVFDGATVQNIDLMNGGLKVGDKSLKPEKGSFQQKLTIFTGTDDKAQITNVVSGPGNKVIFSVTGLGGRPLFPNDGGVAEMEGTKVTGIYRSRPEYFVLGGGRVGTDLDNKDIAALATSDKEWITFFKNREFPAGVVTFGSAAPGIAVGPTGNKGPDGKPTKDLALSAKEIGRYVVAAAYSPSNKTLYIATEDAQIFALKADTLGDAKLDIKKNKPVVGYTNAKITALAVVGGSVLIGAESSKADNGGVAILNTQDNSVTAFKAVGRTVRNIGVSIDGQTAMIATASKIAALKDKGLVFFDGKNLVEKFEAAAEGSTAAAGSVQFANVPPPFADLIAVVQMKNENWYAFDSGKGAYEIASKTAERDAEPKADAQPKADDAQPKVEAQPSADVKAE